MSPATESDTVLSTLSYFLRVLPLHNPPLNKEQQILTCLLYSPYMLDLYPLPTVNTLAAGSIVPAAIEKEVQPPFGDLVSFRLMLPSGNPGIFRFAQHYVCLPVSGDVTAGHLPVHNINCPPKFLLLLSFFSFL